MPYRYLYHSMIYRIDSEVLSSLSKEPTDSLEENTDPSAHSSPPPANGSTALGSVLLLASFALSGAAIIAGFALLSG